MSGGMVATSQPLATEAGLAIFREGGNAADAMVAACAVLAVVEPTSTGLGGDGWALHYEAATRRVTSLNGTGRSPAALTSARLEAEGIVGRSVPPRHAHAVTVPGCVAALCDLAARHGSFPLRRLLAPAIRFAEEGFPVTPVTAAFWARSEALLGGAPGGGMFLPGGRAPRAGERFRNPDLARILRRIAEGGADAFYRGEVACAVACAVREAGGCLDEADLAGHVSTWDEPLSAPYRGVRVWECPPNGQGIAALLALRIAEGFDLASLDPLGSARLHLLIESMRLAFTEARAVVADPAHIPVPAASLLEEARVRALRARIDPACALPDPQGPPPGHGTVYLCAVDGAGNAVSIACSNYQGFGTGIVPAGCGFTLQNRGAGFSLDPASPNVLAPRKRPFHTVMPGMLTRPDGSLLGPFGVMGGVMQPQGHLQVVVALVDDALDPQAALDRPRFCIATPEEGAVVRIEAPIPEVTLSALARLGHPVRGPLSGIEAQAVFGRGQVILRDPDGMLRGGSDRRCDGCAGMA